MKTLILTTILVAGLATPALACACKKDLNHTGMHVKGDAGAPSKAYHHANMVMHKGMDITFSGDADIDFLKGMIAHHQGAVDMAQIQLKYGKDARVKRLAREVIRAQNLEIRWMKNWLDQLEANKQGYQDSTWLGESPLGAR